MVNKLVTFGNSVVNTSTLFYRDQLFPGLDFDPLFTPGNSPSAPRAKGPHPDFVAAEYDAAGIEAYIAGGGRCRFEGRSRCRGVPVVEDIGDRVFVCAFCRDTSYGC